MRSAHADFLFILGTKTIILCLLFSMNPFFLSILIGIGCKKAIPTQTEHITPPKIQATVQEQAARFLQPNEFKERVLLTHLAAIRVQANGKTYMAKPPLETPTPKEHVARSSQSGIQILMKIGCGSLVFFAYVEQKDLLLTTTQKTKLYGESGKDFQTASIQFAAGAPITVQKCQNSRCKISLNPKGYLHPEAPAEPLDGHLKAWGWVDKSDLGYVYQPQNFSLKSPEDCFYIEKGVKLYDGEKGEAILEFTEERMWHAFLQPDATTLTIQQKRMHATGTIHPEQIHHSQCYPTRGKGHGCAWGISDTKLIMLKRATPIFDQPNGKVVGVVAKDDRFILHQEKAGWREISVYSQWEGLSFWVQTLKN